MTQEPALFWFTLYKPAPKTRFSSASPQPFIDPRPRLFHPCGAFNSPLDKRHVAFMIGHWGRRAANRIGRIRDGRGRASAIYRPFSDKLCGIFCEEAGRSQFKNLCRDCVLMIARLFSTIRGREVSDFLHKN